MILLPTIPYGVDSNMRELPLAIDVRQSTLNRIVTDIVASLAHQGIHKVVLFNGHGGNEFKPLVRDLQGRYGVLIVVVNFWQVRPDLLTEIFDEVISNQ